jgi:hypothetical protein
VQEIAYRSQGYETAARLLGIRARLRLGDQKIDIGPPARESSSRLAGRLSQPRLEALIAEGARLEPGGAIAFTVAVLTQLAAAAEPRGPVLGTSTTAGTRLMIIAPYSAPQRRSS